MENVRNVQILFAGYSRKVCLVFVKHFTHSQSSQEFLHRHVRFNFELWNCNMQPAAINILKTFQL